MYKPTRPAVRHATEPLTPTIRARFKDADVPLDPDDPAYKKIMQTVIVLNARTGRLTTELLRAATEIGRLKLEAERIYADYIDMQATIDTTEQQFLLDEKRRQIREEQESTEASDTVPSLCHVYYVRRGNLVKIGTTSDLYRRMSAILPDEVLAVEPGSYALESKMHSKFHHLRAESPGQREWFRLEQELHEHIERVRDFHGNPPVGLPTLPSGH